MHEMFKGYHFIMDTISYKHLVDLLNQAIFSEVLTGGHVLKLHALSNCSNEKLCLK